MTGHLGTSQTYGVPEAALFAQASTAVPNFWIGLLLVLLFAVRLGWLPSGDFPGWAGGMAPALPSLLLPAVALALPQAGVLTRVTRGAMLDTLGEDFICTACAKGLPKGVVVAPCAPQRPAGRADGSRADRDQVESPDRVKMLAQTRD